MYKNSSYTSVTTDIDGKVKYKKITTLPNGENQTIEKIFENNKEYQKFAGKEVLDDISLIIDREFTPAFDRLFDWVTNVFDDIFWLPKPETLRKTRSNNSSNQENSDIVSKHKLELEKVKKEKLEKENIEKENIEKKKLEVKNIEASVAELELLEKDFIELWNELGAWKVREDVEILKNKLNTLR